MPLRRCANAATGGGYVNGADGGVWGFTVDRAGLDRRSAEGIGRGIPFEMPKVPETKARIEALSVEFFEEGGGAESEQGNA